MVSRWRQRVARIAQVGASDADTPDERIYKEAVNLSALLISVLSCAWVATYAALGLWVSAAIPLVYQLLTLGGSCSSQGGAGTRPSGAPSSASCWCCRSSSSGVSADSRRRAPSGSGR